MPKTDYYVQARICHENNEYGQAKALYEKAVENRNADAMFSLGVMYLIGQGIPRDAGLAKRYILKAKQEAHPVAMFYWDIIKGMTQEDLDADESGSIFETD